MNNLVFWGKKKVEKIIQLKKGMRVRIINWCFVLLGRTCVTSFYFSVPFNSNVFPFLLLMGVVASCSKYCSPRSNYVTCPWSRRHLCLKPKMRSVRQVTSTTINAHLKTPRTIGIYYDIGPKISGQRPVFYAAPRNMCLYFKVWRDSL